MMRAAPLALLVAASPALAQQTDAELAKKLANPVASLISVPFQQNLDFGIGDNDALRSTLNVQPVVPFTLNDDWNLISRNIVPLIYAEAPSDAADDAFGLGDVVSSFFFSPSDSSSGVTWGIGPVFLLPTATDDALGSEKWGAGPTGVVLKQEGPWTYGILANHLWSFAGEDDRREVNATFMQPFLNYTTPAATSYFLNTETTYDWQAEEWTVPVNFGVNQLVNWGGQRVQLGGGARVYLDRPDGGPDWGLRFNLVFLFPK